MKKIRRWISRLLVFAILLTSIPVCRAGFVMAKDRGSIAEFIKDDRWKNGVSWNGKHGSIFQGDRLHGGGDGCNGYVRDFTLYVHGVSLNEGSKFTNKYELNTGDVGHWYVSDTDQHWFAVIGRSGNWLHVAEGNYAPGVVHIQENRYNIKDMKFSYGYHYSGSGNVSPSLPQSQPVKNASVKAIWADKYDTNMVCKAKVYNPGRKRISVCGIQVRDGNNIIGRKEEVFYPINQYVSEGSIEYNLNTEVGISLRPGHVYGWQVYADVNGTRYYTDWINDRTTGTEKPNTPSLSTSKTDYAVGDAVTVCWGADAAAYSGYSMTITQTKGGSYTKTQTTDSANATSIAFSLPGEGEYQITGFARGGVNSDTAVLNKTIVAHNPSKVRFVEYDKDNKENLLCEQTVRYGYSAIAPTGISRKGHTFTGWKGEYSNVTSDRTIVAQFKRNSYKVTFVDKDGNIVDTQSVLYENDAIAPTPPEAEAGYVFAGWDNEDYKNVQGNVTVKACYVWKNNDLPVLVEINSCIFKEDGYIVNYNIKNNPDKRTRCRGIFSLRTSTGKLINSTESGAFSLDKAEYRKNLEMYIPYDGVATNVSLYIVDRFSSGIPYSQTVSYELEREWSDWIPTNPGEKVEVENRTEYRYRNLLTATTRNSVNEGWNLVDTIFDTDWNYGSWSGWSRTAYSPSETINTKREVQSKDVSNNDGYSRRIFYYWKDPNKLAFSYYNEGGMIYYEYCENSYDSLKMRAIGSYNGQTKYYIGDYGCNFRSECWFLKQEYSVPATSHKEYRYRDATKGYSYKWSKWDDWSDWTTDEVNANPSKEVESRTTYRYRAKMTDLENNEGKEYTINGSVDSLLAGKEALIQVYKGDEPSDSNNEYVGKVTINEDGTFSHKFVCRQEISEKTGDYKVMMAIEGGDEPFYLETIEAPKPKYTVIFKGMNGEIIDTQTVTLGHSATSPKAPEEQNYTFIGWDYGVTNIRDDMEITAQYAKNKYSVAFVNWETKEAYTEVFSYGDPVSYPEIKEIEGYDFVNWTTPDGKTITNVTDNTILSANYKIKTFKVRFFNNDGEVISSQDVEYLNDAMEPEADKINGMVFDGWNEYGFIGVKSDVDIYPIYKYIETTDNPTCDTESGVFTESKKIHLSAPENAKIYYSTDGTIPTQASSEYKGELIISKNTFLQYIAAEPNKNTSEVMSASFLVASGEDDEGALVVKKEKYVMKRGNTEKITYFLSHNDPDMEVEYYSLDENIASIENDGIIHANNVGKTRIFVSTKDRKYADYCDVEVSTDDIDLEYISLDKTSIVGVKDEQIQISASVYPENATVQTVDWYSDDEDIAVVENGLVTIKKKGTTTLKAYASNGSYVAACKVEGIGDYSESKLKMSMPYMYLYENATDFLYAIYDDTMVECEWSSSNEKVATVNDGEITAKAVGTSEITATTEDGTQVTSIVIVSKNEEKQEPTVEPTTEPTVEPTTEPTVEPTTEPTVGSTTGSGAAPITEPKVTSTSSIKVPKAVKGLKVNSAKKSLKLSWKKSSDASGYEIQYSLNRKFKNLKKITIKKASKTKYTIKGLKKKKNYYVRIRAYKKIGSAKMYSNWKKALKKTK